MGSDLSVVNAARVSFGKKSEGVLSWVAYGDKLAKPVFVPNEADTKLIHYLANHGHYSPFGHKKQGSSKETISEVWMQDYGENWKGDPSFIASAKAESDCMFYNSLIQSGVAPEMARVVLPQSMYTEWYWSGSMDAFANMCNLRLKEDTQYETRLVAQQIDKVMGELYPVSWTALVGEKK